MASLVTTQTDYTADGLAHVWTLFDDGTITITDAKGAAITVTATPATTAQAQGFAAAAAADANASSLKAKAGQALTANANFLAITSPSAGQVANQVKALTRQMNALIRLVTKRLDDTAGT